jgi:AbrB family looped-hinge helix DNA binding protein
VEPSDRRRAIVDKDGRLVLPAETATRLGLAPGTQVLLEDVPNGVALRRASTHLAKLYIEPTSHCNLNCHMCIRNSWDEIQGNMEPETFERLIESLKRLEQKPVIVFGGFGEPLFHPGIMEMVAQAREVAQRVEIVTNGLLLTEAMLDDFIHLPLDVLWFSVDRLHTDASGRPSDLLPKIEKLHHAREVLNARLPETGLVFVATRANLQELPVLVRGAVRYGIAHYMVTNLLPYSEDVCDQTLYSRTLDHMESKPSYWSPRIQLPRMDWNEDSHQPLYQVLHARPGVRIHDVNLGMAGGRCPFIEAGAVAVSWNGAVSPCLALMHSHASYLLDNKRLVSRYVIGNIHDSTLADLWSDRTHLAFRKRVQEFDFSPCTLCGGCDMAEANQEDCFGNTFPTCGGCLWAWGVVQCP